MTDATTPGYPCPACDEQLTTRNSSPDAWMFCEANGGMALRDEALRDKLSDKIVDRLWLAARDAAQDSKRLCPLCQDPMVAFDLVDRRRGALIEKQDAVELDACAACHVVWFDPLELRDADTIATDPEALLLSFYLGPLSLLFS